MIKPHSILIFLYSIVLISESTLLGNAFVFYTGLPRYLLFFTLLIIILFVQKRSINPIIYRSYLYIFLIMFCLLISLAFFDGSHFLRSFKAIAFCCVLFSSVNPKEMTGRALTSFLYLSNFGLLLAALIFILPSNLSFTPEFLFNLRRFDEGFPGGFYWMKNFSGIFMIGDDPVPFLNGIPRYSGYFSEPGVNAFYILLGYASLLYCGQKVSKLTNLITFTNLMLTFSIAGFLASFLLAVYFIARRFSLALKLSLLISAPLIILLVIELILSQENYFSDKLQNSSADASRRLLINLFRFNLSGSESILNSDKVGEFAFLPQMLMLIVIGYTFLMYLSKFLLSGTNLKYDSGLFFCVVSVFLLKTGPIILVHLVFIIIVLMPMLPRQRS